MNYLHCLFTLLNLTQTIATLGNHIPAAGSMPRAEQNADGSSCICLQRPCQAICLISDHLGYIKMLIRLRLTLGVCWFKPGVWASSTEHPIVPKLIHTCVDWIIALITNRTKGENLSSPAHCTNMHLRGCRGLCVANLWDCFYLHKLKCRQFSSGSKSKLMLGSDHTFLISSF